MKVTKRQLGVEKFASVDRSRTNLKSVYLRRNEAIATNGHILAIATAPDAIQNNGADPVLIDSDHANTISGVIKAKKSDALEMKTVEIDKEKIKAPLHGFEFKTQNIHGKYPPIDHVIPDYSDYHSFAVDSVYLTRICDHISKGQKRAWRSPPTVKITFKDKDSAILLEANDDDGHKLKFVLMPVRL